MIGTIVAMTVYDWPTRAAAEKGFRRDGNAEDLIYGADNRMAKSASINKD
jgi:hypothetical protein